MDATRRSPRFESFFGRRASPSPPFSRLLAFFVAHFVVRALACRKSSTLCGKAPQGFPLGCAWLSPPLPLVGGVTPGAGWPPRGTALVPGALRSRYQGGGLGGVAVPSPPPVLALAVSQRRSIIRFLMMDRFCFVPGPPGRLAVVPCRCGVCPALLDILRIVLWGAPAWWSFVPPPLPRVVTNKTVPERKRGFAQRFF